jgi:hypothetical protein
MSKLFRGQVGSKNINRAIAAAVTQAAVEGVAQGLAEAQVEDLVAAAVDNLDLPEFTAGVAVPDSAEATSPTTAEFNALLASLRGGGFIAAE